ncbi:MAG: 50S ribosomal protein L10 [Bacilli bacterium]|nr:50S ribosomal protein L10 [Bacilli bacterium]
MNKTVLQEKQETVASIADGIKNCGTFAVVSYQGLTVAELQELRRALAKEETTVGVYKNTLVARALKEAGDPDLSELLSGPNAFVFSKDISKGPKALVKFARYHEKLVIKGGLVEGKVVDKAGLITVSKLPDKNGMVSMLLSVLQAPIRNFACALDGIAKKAGEAPAAN